MKKSWEAALGDCIARGANLASIHNQEEEEFLSLYTKGSSKWIGWLRFKNKCFLFKGKKNDIKGNWSYARNWCKEQGGDLHLSRDLEHPAWIGLSDLLAENQYAWSDGVSPVLYTHWDNNEPNNVGGTEHCVTMNHNMLMSGKWNDDACHKNHSFVCYRKKCR
uniref:C-type lectin domain-containing protein n=1 Tax=Oryzias latipes TaxID=8090 RepID=A0A3P9J598_ORYLA